MTSHTRRHLLIVNSQASAAFQQQIVWDTVDAGFDGAELACTECEQAAMLEERMPGPLPSYVEADRSSDIFI